MAASLSRERAPRSDGPPPAGAWFAVQTAITAPVKLAEEQVVLAYIAPYVNFPEVQNRLHPQVVGVMALADVCFVLPGLVLVPAVNLPDYVQERGRILAPGPGCGNQVRNGRWFL